MFLIGLWGVLDALLLWACLMFNRVSFVSSNGAGWFWAFVVILIIINIILILIITNTYSEQLRRFTSVKEKNKQIELYQEKSDSLSAVIKKELRKYPAIEKAIMGKIEPRFLMNFPELKSNETIMKMVDSLVELESKVYAIKERRLDILENIYYREISPWVLKVKTYQDFFGAVNPITLEDESEDAKKDK